MERETYKEYILEQVWTLKDEKNTYFGHKPIKIFYKGKGTRIAISEYNVRGLKRKADAKNRVALFQQQATYERGYSLYNVETHVKEMEYYVTKPTNNVTIKNYV